MRQGLEVKAVHSLCLCFVNLQVIRELLGIPGYDRFNAQTASAECNFNPTCLNGGFVDLLQGVRGWFGVGFGP